MCITVYMSGNVWLTGLWCVCGDGAWLGSDCVLVRPAHGTWTGPRNPAALGSNNHTIFLPILYSVCPRSTVCPGSSDPPEKIF